MSTISRTNERTTTKEGDIASPKVRLLANVILVGAAMACVAALLYFLYFYGWTGQRQFGDWKGVVLYYVFPGGLALLFLASLRMRAAAKLDLALLLATACVCLVSLESLLTVWSSLPSVMEQQNRNIRANAAKAVGITYDMRSKLQVYRDLVKQGVDAVPSFERPLTVERSDGTVASDIRIDGREVLPFGSVANRLVVLCNEGGTFLTYKSDRYGFHNPAEIWQTRPIDIVTIGDSYTQGYCVEDNFVSLIRKRHPATLNLGMEGTGPLTQLAILKEYARAVHPKTVLMFYFEGNDLADLTRERKSPLLKQYLTKGFSQDLMPHQDEIDRALKGYVAAIQVKSNAAIKLQEAWTAIKDYKKLEKQIVPTLKLSQLRERLGLVYGTEANNAGSRDAEPSGERRVWQRSQLDLVYEILVEARRTVDEWGGDLYLVYLPVYYRYVPDSDTARNSELEQVVALARKAGLSTINIDDRFKTHNDPLSLFPFRLPGHYNAEGHRQVAEEVLERLTAE